MEITSPVALAVFGGLALLIPIALVVTWQRRPRGVPGALVRLVAILLSQLLALLTGLLIANREYDFYSSWSDLLGIKSNGAVAAGDSDVPTADSGQGRIESRTVRSTGTGPGAERLQVLVWLPDGYDDAAKRKTQLPVLMMLPAQPSAPQATVKSWDFPAQASAAIQAGKIKPFIAVFPPIMIDPPRDTECTDVPKGPQAETWLTDNVRDDITEHYSASPKAADWYAAGFSTGGYCAGKLLIRNRDKFGAAVSIGGYFNALQDDTTGDLWGGSTKLRNENSPRWIIKQGSVPATNLLIITSKEDRSSYEGKEYADSKQMIADTEDVPGVSTILLDSGGHNLSTYGPTLPAALAWLGSLQ